MPRSERKSLAQKPPKTGTVKFLGKAFVDRKYGKPLDEIYLRRAIATIKNASDFYLPKATITVSEQTVKPSGAPMAACIVVNFKNKSVPSVKSAILNILSLGRIGSIVYYVTAGLETEEYTRYWVRAFQAKSRSNAQELCVKMIEMCTSVQPGWNPQRGGSQLSLGSTTSTGSSHKIDLGGNETSTDPYQGSYPENNVHHMYQQYEDESLLQRSILQQQQHHHHHQQQQQQQPGQKMEYVTKYGVQMTQPVARRNPLQSVANNGGQTRAAHGAASRKSNMFLRHPADHENAGRFMQPRDSMHLGRQASLNMDEYLSILDV